MLLEAAIAELLSNLNPNYQEIHVEKYKWKTHAKFKTKEGA